MSAPTCYQCGSRTKKKAKVLPNPEGYYHWSKQKVFCSLRCAATHTMNRIDEVLEREHFCQRTSRWEFESTEECSSCAKKEAKNEG